MFVLVNTLIIALNISWAKGCCEGKLRYSVFNACVLTAEWLLCVETVYTAEENVDVVDWKKDVYFGFMFVCHSIAQAKGHILKREISVLLEGLYTACVQPDTCTVYW